jgi:hypothetical protein
MGFSWGPDPRALGGLRHAGRFSLVGLVGHFSFRSSDAAISFQLKERYGIPEFVLDHHVLVGGSTENGPSSPPQKGPFASAMEQG